jgi:hypothetical protein
MLLGFVEPWCAGSYEIIYKFRNRSPSSEKPYGGFGNLTGSPLAAPTATTPRAEQHTHRLRAHRELVILRHRSADRCQVRSTRFHDAASSASARCVCAGHAGVRRRGEKSQLLEELPY